MNTPTRKLESLPKTGIVGPCLQRGLHFVLGLCVALSGLIGSQAFAGTNKEEHKQEQSGKSHNVFGGIVVHVQKLASSKRTQLLLDITPMDQKGHPVCSKPTGSLIRVLAAPKPSTPRERSSFMVVESIQDPLPSYLNVGDCLTVDGNDVDRFSRAPKNEDSIQILPATPSSKSQTIRLIQALSVTLWPGSQSQELRRTTHLPVPSPAYPLFIKQQKA
ncbi:MAG: hypothetical protein ACYCYP_05255 [Leptospirales bacterium]